MAGEPKRRSGSRWPFVVLALIVLYPLSIGPVGWLSDQLGPGRVNETLEFAYAPLWIAVEHTGTGELAQRYMEMFDP